LRRHQQLTGLAASLRVVEAAEGKDVSDHLAAGHTVEELVLADPWAPMADHDEMPDGAGVISDRPAWRSALIDWTAFWARDRQDLDWLVEPFIARGRAHALAAPAKTGKSLLTLEAVAALATGRSVLAQPAGDPVDVVYVDFEMTEDDLHERLTDLGYGTDDDLSHLHYHLLPSLPPLDTDAGGWVLEQMAGDHHAGLLVIDTIGRAVDGPENDAETFLAFRRYAGTRLKRLGVAAVRLDHYGKDGDRGQRGSSAKNDDVDVVWQLTPGDSGSVRLRATHKRMAWVPEVVPLQRGGDPLRHRLVEDTWPTGAAEAVEMLDKLNVPLDIGRPKPAKYWPPKSSVSATTSSPPLCADVGPDRREAADEPRPARCHGRGQLSGTAPRAVAGQLAGTAHGHGPLLAATADRDSAGQAAAATGGQSPPQLRGDSPSGTPRPAPRPKGDQ
jgi:hypothetical protein